jgi:hypothetical protein
MTSDEVDGNCHFMLHSYASSQEQVQFWVSWICAEEQCVCVARLGALGKLGAKFIHRGHQPLKRVKKKSDSSSLSKKKKKKKRVYVCLRDWQCVCVEENICERFIKGLASEPKDRLFFFFAFPREIETLCSVVIAMDILNSHSTVCDR